ncbi:BnaC01g44790D [Brassica napus]|uniref:BnaC01g44790D protein n=1 Tax=Brassica napus TaxID=3708 RepID=A0A078IXV7_BRANA|nr:BnaC01g44790D [Brassica napus]
MRSKPKVSKVIWKRSKAANIAAAAMPSPYITFQRKTRILLYYGIGSPIHSPF